MPISTTDFTGDEPDLGGVGEKESRGKWRPKKSKRAKVEDNWLAEVEEEPRAGTPIAEQLAKREKWTRRYLIVCAILAPILLLGLFIAVSRDPIVPEADNDAIAADRVRAEAAITIEEWLGSGEAPITNGKILQWEETVDLPSLEANEETGDPAGPAMQSVRFLVNQPGGNGTNSALYEVEVLVASRESGEVATVGYPSMSPVLPALDLGKVDRWPTLELDASPSEEVNAAIEDWARAYTSGSAQQLRAVINDNDSSRTYVPYNNMHLEEVATSEAGIIETSNPSDEDEEPVPTRIVVAVTLTMTDRSKECNDCPESIAEFDVLIEDANTVTPRVVAWGAPGTGPVMKPHQNAIPTNDEVEDALEDILSNAVEPSDGSTTTPPEDSDDQETTRPKDREGKKNKKKGKGQ